MTDQPQPTAALSDAELLAIVSSSTGRSETAMSKWNAAYAELMRRLARAGSAPGVTIPSDIAIYAHTILGDMGPDEVDGDSWPTHVATVRILGDAIDAALADAGTEAE